MRPPTSRVIGRYSEDEVLAPGTIVRRGVLEVEAGFWIDLIGSDDDVVLCESPIMELSCAFCVDDDKYLLVKGPRSTPVSDDTASLDVYSPSLEGLAHVFAVEGSISFGVVFAYLFAEQLPSRRLLYIRHGLNEGCGNNTFLLSGKLDKRQ